jgi:MFS family permease
MKSIVSKTGAPSSAIPSAGVSDDGSRGAVMWLGNAMRNLPRDGRVLFLTRFIRLFSYGSLSVVLVFYLTALGLSESQAGLLLTLTLLGDTVISLSLTTQADQIGRRRMLIAAAALMASAGLAFASTHNFLFLVVAGTIGVISPRLKACPAMRTAALSWDRPTRPAAQADTRLPPPR